MGKYSMYIWASFGLTFAFMLLTAVSAYFSHFMLRRELKAEIEQNSDVT